MAKDPIIRVVQDTTLLLQRIPDNRLQVITNKFKPSRFRFFSIKCEAYRKGLTPSFFNTVYPGARFFWDEIFTCIEKNRVLQPTGTVFLVVKRKRAEQIKLGKMRIFDHDGTEHDIDCENIDYHTFVNNITVNRKCMAEFPPPPMQNECYRDHRREEVKEITLSRKSVGTIQRYDDSKDLDHEMGNDNIPSMYVPKKLIPVDLNIASSIVEKISQRKLCKVAMVYLDCLYKRDVTFEEIKNTVGDIFGPISEESLFIRSDASYANSELQLPNGSCFIICDNGVVLDDKIVKRKTQEKRINFGEFKVPTIARAIIDGRILMFTRGMLNLGVQFREIFGFDPNKLPKLTHDGKSILTRSTTTPFGQLGNIPLLNGLILPSILTKGDLMKPIMISGPTKSNIEKTSLSIDSTEKSNSFTQGSLKLSETKQETNLESTTVRSPVDSTKQPLADRIQEEKTETTPQNLCPKKTKLKSKICEQISDNVKSDISLKLSKLEQDLLKKCLYEEERNEFVGQRLEKAHKQGNVVILIRKTPSEWSIHELKQLFGLKKLENDRVLAMYTDKKNGRALSNLRIIMSDSEDTQKILACHKKVVAGKTLNVRRSDFKEYELWLKYNWKNIKTLDR